MENRDVHLFRANCITKLFVLLLTFAMVMSFPANGKSIFDVMKDTQLCDNIKVLYESRYTKSCAKLEYPSEVWNNTEDTLDKYLCLGVYDTAIKICQNKYSQIPNNTAVFDSIVEKFVPPENEEDKTEFCKKNLQGLTMMDKQIESLWGPLAEKFKKSQTCQRICFDFSFVFRPLCAVLAWIKNIEDKNKSNAVDHDPAALDVPKVPANHLPDKKKPETEQKEIEKKTEEKESKEQLHNKTKNTSSNVPSDHTQSNIVKVELDPEKSNKHETQKTLNATTSMTQDYNPHIGKESTSDIKTNVEAAKTSANMPSNENVNTKDKDVEKAGEMSEIEDTKTSTISENTQDHDSAGNGEDDMGEDNGIDTLDQPGTGNQNMGVQEPFEQKSLQYPRIRTEDSHFFTYFTVTTVACIVCYIGYHNKQKILAIVLEGRRSRSSRNRRRPSTASYRKLDCTLEEAVTSQCNANVTHVIY